MISKCERLRFGGIFNFDKKHVRLTEINRQLEDVAIWQDPERAQMLAKERSDLGVIVDTLKQLDKDLNDLAELAEIVEETDDEELTIELLRDVNAASKEVDKLEFQRMFSGKMDANDAYLEINAGSGGTEAQDWAEMLLRMYLRWAEKHDFKSEMIEVSPGEVAGIKSATVKISGSYVYGWARTESGVHRLVRKSPFDSGNRRHTSFASVFVSPVIEDNIEIDINPADLRIDTYRSQGAGGQHVNTTDSAVRITHVPTGIVAQCQNDRSQHKNRAQAMQQLRSKLYQLELQEKMAERQAQEDAKMGITWGSQIRSYILDDARVKDLRTGIENRNPQEILDGELDMFIEESLKQGV